MSGFWAYLQTVDLNQIRSQIQGMVTAAPPATPGQPNTPAPAFNDETLVKIEKWAPTAFAAFATFYCLFRHPVEFLIGLSLAVHQKRYPDHLTNRLESFAKANLRYKDKKFGQLSIILDSHIATISVAAIAAMWAPNVAKSCVPTYFTYVAATELLSPVEEPKK